MPLIGNSSSAELTVFSSKNESKAVDFPLTTANKTKLVGKHSKDQKLALFIHKRNINQLQSTEQVEEILGLVRISPEAQHQILQKNSQIVIGVMARLLCDYGLQFSENFVFQRETRLFPQPEGCEVFEAVEEDGVLGDAILPDNLHRGFKIKLPRNLPPSTIFLNPENSMGSGLVGDSPWGLTYYVYAYIVNASASIHQAGDLFGLAHQGTRKSSKVFLSFTRSIRSDCEAMARELRPAAAAVNKILMPTNKSISLEAALDKPFVFSQDSLTIHLKLNNPKAASLGGLRVTLKQLITSRSVNDSKQVIKVPLAVYEFPGVDENGKFQLQGSSGRLLPLKDFPFIIDTVRVDLRPGNFLNQVAVESRLPRSAIKELILAPSFAQSYESGQGSLRFLSVEYYLNVHVIVPWGTNLIAKLPFTVASRGATESLYESDNLSSWGTASKQQPEHVTTTAHEDDFEDQNQLFHQIQSQRQQQTAPPTTNASLDELERARQSFPIERLKREFEKALRQLDSLRGSFKASSGSLAAFEASRRTWTRELADATVKVTDKIEKLAKLVVIADPYYKSAYLPSPMDAGVPSELLESIVSDFVPAYRKCASAHESQDHRDSIMEALNSALDCLELVFMKFHTSLVPTLLQNGEELEIDVDFSGRELCELIRGRMMGDFLRLVLVLPGMVEWRWFLEGLALWSLQGGALRTLSSDLDLSEGLKYARLDDEDQMTLEELNFSLASQFQSIHDRLTRGFTDAALEPSEIVQYGKTLSSVLNRKKQMESIAQCTACHFRYFKVALFVHYGSYPRLLVPFDASLEDPLGLLGLPADLKELRALLTPLRTQLIQTMTQ